MGRRVRRPGRGSEGGNDPDRPGCGRTEYERAEHCYREGPPTHSLALRHAADRAEGIAVPYSSGGEESMKIATVTLNPAIDLTVRADHFRPNTVNYAQAMQFDAGGKGVNVASFLTDAGFTTAVTGFLGQENTDIFEQFFARKGIADQFVRIPGRTRTGVKVVDEANQQTTDINMPGLPPSEAAMETLRQTIERLASTYDWFALSGR